MSRQSLKLKYDFLTLIFCVLKTCNETLFSFVFTNLTIIWLEWLDRKAQRRMQKTSTMMTSMESLLRPRKRRSRSRKKQLGKLPSTWLNTSVPEYWVPELCKSGFSSIIKLCVLCSVFSGWDYVIINFLFWLISMNAPVMVELEGETDPLEVWLFTCLVGWYIFFPSWLCVSADLVFIVRILVMPTQYMDQMINLVFVAVMCISYTCKLELDWQMYTIFMYQKKALTASILVLLVFS